MRNPATLSRRAADGDVAPLSVALARAFRDDPLHRWVFPSERAWARRSHRLFALILRSELRHGVVFTTLGHKGAAVWHAPDYDAGGLAERLFLDSRLLHIIGCRAPLVAHGLSRLARQRPASSHWYLAHLGTDPDHQRQGVASSLMAPILARCDDQRCGAYLEASRAENIPFYRRHGFQVVGPFQLPRGPVVWRMLRPARR